MGKATDSINSYRHNLKDLQYVSEYSTSSYILTGAVILMLIYWWYSKETRKYKLPPGPRGIPILGYLPFLGKKPYKDFDRLSKKYGGVFSLNLGQTFVVILGDYEAVKEAFSKSSTLDRPERLFDFIPDGVGFSSVNGEEWVEQRKYSLKAMRDLGLGRSKWENLVQEEVEDFIKLIQEFEGRPADISRLLTASVSNNISSLVFGKKLPLTDKNVDFVCGTLDSAFNLALQTGWRHYFPFLYDLLVKFGVSRVTVVQNEIENFHNYVRNEVELRKQTFVPGSTDVFIDGYLTEIKNNEEQNLGNTFNEKNLRGNVQALFLGGSDTTRNSLNWLMLCMAKYPDVQKKVHQELDAVLGKDGKIQWTEKFSVPYTYAVIMEGQRWMTIAPVNTSRIATEDIKIRGYDIPKGTTIIANNWGLHNDTKYWKEPEKFMPERFLLEDGKRVNYKPDSYVPFSYGKRNCPGEVVAMVEILCYFATIMQSFEVLPPENETLQLEGILGLTYQPMPQKLRFVSRR